MSACDISAEANYRMMHDAVYMELPCVYMCDMKDEHPQPKPNSDWEVSH